MNFHFTVASHLIFAKGEMLLKQSTSMIRKKIILILFKMPICYQDKTKRAVFHCRCDAHTCLPPPQSTTPSDTKGLSCKINRRLKRRKKVYGHSKLNCRNCPSTGKQLGHRLSESTEAIFAAREIQGITHMQRGEGQLQNLPRKKTNLSHTEMGQMSREMLQTYLVHKSSGLKQLLVSRHSGIRRQNDSMRLCTQQPWLQTNQWQEAAGSPFGTKTCKRHWVANLFALTIISTRVDDRVIFKYGVKDNMHKI